MIAIPDWLQSERRLNHLIGGGVAAALAAAFGLMPMLRSMGVARWPAYAQDIVSVLLSLTLVGGPAIATIALAALVHLKLRAH